MMINSKISSFSTRLILQSFKFVLALLFMHNNAYSQIEIESVSITSENEVHILYINEEGLEFSVWYSYFLDIDMTADDFEEVPPNDITNTNNTISFENPVPFEKLYYQLRTE